MSKHWSVCNYFFKDTNKVFDIFNKKSAEFLLKKVKQPKTKLKFLKDLKEKVGCADPYDIQIKNLGFLQPTGLTRFITSRIVLVLELLKG